MHTHDQQTAAERYPTTGHRRLSDAARQDAVEILVVRPCACRVHGRAGVQPHAPGARIMVSRDDARALVECANAARYVDDHRVASAWPTPLDSRSLTETAATPSGLAGRETHNDWILIAEPGKAIGLDQRLNT
jgi:hypothetical protein